MALLKPVACLVLQQVLATERAMILMLERKKFQMYGNTLVNQRTRQKQFVQFVRKSFLTNEEQQISETTWELNNHFSILQRSQQPGMQLLTIFVWQTKCSEARAKNITDQVSQMTVQDLCPIKIVECKGFRSLLSYLEPDYTLPSDKNFVSDINHKFEMSKDRLKSHVESEAPCVSITTDIWRSIATEAHIMVTANYINASWKI